MQIYIIIPYRPLRKSNDLRDIPEANIRQLPDGRWIDKDGKYRYGGSWRYDGKAVIGKDDDIMLEGSFTVGQDELIRAIKIINKNSYYKHRIVVVIDSDVYPNNTWLKEFDNVDILKCPYIGDPNLFKTDSGLAIIQRMNVAHMHGINNISDEEWLCHAYISDLICSKHWDKPIIDAIEKYGYNYIYVPMFTEVLRNHHSNNLIGIKPTPELIWEEWRKTICCHALTMPMPEKGYFTEEDMDNYIKISNQYNKPPIIIEKPGDRIYGYYAVMIMKAKHAKRAIRFDGHGFDILFDNRLYTDCNLMKVAVTNSYVFHPFCPFKWSK